MLYGIGGLLIVLVGLIARQKLAAADPASRSRMLKQGFATLFFLLALVLMLRGRLEFALISAVIGFGLFGSVYKGKAPHKAQWDKGQGAPGMGREGPGRISRLRSAMIEMEIDHATGAIRGLILAGPNEGQWLDRQNWTSCQALYRFCLINDPAGARLLEAYFDSRFSGWRAAGQAEGDARHGGAGSGAMSEDEAYEILGLQKGATREDLVRAHRTLMKKLHPDLGGATDLAARVNEARDILMRRHQD